MLKYSTSLPRLSKVLQQQTWTRTLTRLSVSGPKTLAAHRPLYLSLQARQSIANSRRYSQENAPSKAPEAEPTAQAETTEQTDSSTQKLNEIPSERFVQVLKNTASAPWLSQIPSEQEDRLKRAYTLLFQVILYLGRPQEPEAAQQFLVAFESAPVSPESEIGRARRAVAKILQAMIQDISSIPMSSPLRAAHSELFAVFGALLPLYDVHLATREGEVADWAEFWGRAQPILLQLAMKLDEDGYGLKLEDEQEN
ncbi:hypothetical protein BDQ17DRAFT_1364434 [Cyathus striatus]|nr:hypothetical protein BDQ17DRAFT_1364434 [Cyathus striatus]